MKKLVLLFLALPLVLTQNFAQKDIEFGFFAGIANYQGDLAENDIVLGETKISLGGLIRYHVNSKFNIRASGFFGTISGDDANSETLSFRKYRFSANLMEANLMLEWKVFGKIRYNEVGVFIPSITPYLFIGAGYTVADKTTECYHPECLNNGINPFPEPGDINTFVTMPIGIGVRWDFYEYISLGAEWGWRNAFSDYLDGVSLYAKPGNNDWYFFSGATVSFFFGNGSNDFNFTKKAKNRNRYRRAYRT
jgi:OOP family OmpA-OmpF porin